MHSFLRRNGSEMPLRQGSLRHQDETGFCGKGHRLHSIYPCVPSVGWHFVGVLLLQSGGVKVRQDACSGLFISLLPLLFLSSRTSSSPVAVSSSPWFPLIWFHVLLPPHASFALLSSEHPPSHSSRVPSPPPPHRLPSSPSFADGIWSQLGV